jgi:hypothetical protein
MRRRLCYNRRCDVGDALGMRVSAFFFSLQGKDE